MFTNYQHYPQVMQQAPMVMNGQQGPVYVVVMPQQMCVPQQQQQQQQYFAMQPSQPMFPQYVTTTPPPPPPQVWLQAPPHGVATFGQPVVASPQQAWQLPTFGELPQQPSGLKAMPDEHAHQSFTSTPNGESLRHVSMSSTPDTKTDSVSDLRVTQHQEDRTQDRVCETLIADLRSEKTDRTIRSRVLRLPLPLAQAMVSFIARTEAVARALCMQERGIIVAHLVERLGSEGAAPLLHFTRKHFMELSLNQSGCIAVPRILSGIKEEALKVFFDLMMANIHDLVNHPYGNYVVKHFVSLKDRAYSMPVLNDYIVPNIVNTTTNKFGSHVFEELVKSMSMDDLNDVSRKIFGDASTLRSLCHDRFANYCVQTMLRVLATGDPQVHSWCVGCMIGAVRGSPYEQNIMKSAASGFRSTPQQPPQRDTTIQVHT